MPNIESIFDGSGRINPDLDPQTIHPDRRAQYVALSLAQKQCERADAELRIADLAVAEAVRVHDAAQSALPKSTFLDEWRRSTRTHELPVEPDFVIDPLTALQDAVHNLDLCRWRARQCRDAVAASRQNFNIALSAWNQTQPIQTVEDLKKEVIRSNQAERVRRAEAGRLHRPMTITETARAMSGGNRRPGGGASYKRGAVSRAEARTIEVNRMAAARMNGNVAPRIKLPSER
jgi:hypothetical protein